MRPRYPKTYWAANNEAAHTFVGYLGKYDVWLEKNGSRRGIDHDCLILQGPNAWWDAEYVRDCEEKDLHSDKPWAEALALFRSWGYDPSVSPHAA